MSAVATAFSKLGCGQSGVLDQAGRVFLDLPQGFENSTRPRPTEIKLNPLSILHGYMLLDVVDT